jgi:hypothetical protein
MTRRLFIVALFLALGCAEIDEAGGETPTSRKNIGVELQAFKSYEETFYALSVAPWEAVFDPDVYRFQLIEACLPGGSSERYHFCRTTTWSHTVSFQIYNPYTDFCEIKTTYVPRKIHFSIDDLKRFFKSDAPIVRLIQNAAACDAPVPTLQNWIDSYEH